MKVEQFLEEAINGRISKGTLLIVTTTERREQYARLDFHDDQGWVVVTSEGYGKGSGRIPWDSLTDITVKT